MNKKTLRIAGWALGLSMAVAGIGASIGASMRSPIETKADFATSMATSITSGNMYVIGYTNSDSELMTLAPFSSTSQANISLTSVDLAEATAASAWTISSATVDNKSGYTISTVIDEETYYLYTGGTGSKKIKTSTSTSLNTLWDITYSANDECWTIKSLTATAYYLEVYNNQDFRTYSNQNQANASLELYEWNDVASDDYISSLTPANESLSLNAGTIITKDIIGAVTASGSQTVQNYTKYSADLGNYNSSTGVFTKGTQVTFGTTYLSYSSTYDAIRLTATDYPTTANGSTYATVIIPLTINNVASSTFQLALASAASTPITTRTVLEGATDTLKVINYVAGTNPNVSWSTSDESVATVTDGGVVTAVAEGMATITATSKVKNTSGTYSTASIEYTVNSGPAYSLYFNSTVTGFSEIAAADVDSAETKYDTKSLNGIEWTLRTVSGESKNVRVMPATNSNSFIQIGSANNPATSFSIRSNIFGPTKTKITGVTVTALGASGGNSPSKATISVTADDGTFECDDNPTASLSGTTSTDYEFVSTGAYGHVSINFSSITKGIKIVSILVYASTDATDKGAAYAFASKVEPVNTCDATSKSALLSEYASLTPSVKTIADGIRLFDRPSSEDDDFGESYKAAEVFLAEKMAYIASRSNDEANGAGLISFESSASNYVSVLTVAIAAGIGLVGVTGFAFLRRKKEKSN